MTILMELTLQGIGVLRRLLIQTNNMTTANPAKIQNPIEHLLTLLYQVEKVTRRVSGTASGIRGTMLNVVVVKPHCQRVRVHPLSVYLPKCVQACTSPRSKSTDFHAAGARHRGSYRLRCRPKLCHEDEPNSILNSSSRQK